MSSSRVLRFSALVLSVPFFLLALAACNGGSSGGTSSGTGALGGSNVGDDFISLGNGMYENTATGQVSDAQSAGGGSVYDPQAGVFIPEDGGPAYTVGGGTKDVALQRAEIEKAAINDRAARFASEFQMSFDSAVQLVALGDRVHALVTRGGITDADRQAVEQSMLSVAGLTVDELNQAVSQSLAGNDQAASDLMDKAARNLGMPSTADLRDKLLPALGASLN